MEKRRCEKRTVIGQRRRWERGVVKKEDEMVGKRRSKVQDVTKEDERLEKEKDGDGTEKMRGKKLRGIGLRERKDVKEGRREGMEKRRKEGKKR